jgi:hypothetical protein
MQVEASKKENQYSIVEEGEVLGGWPESAHLDHDTPVNVMIK